MLYLYIEFVKTYYLVTNVKKSLKKFKILRFEQNLICFLNKQLLSESY